MKQHKKMHFHFYILIHISINYVYNGTKLSKMLVLCTIELKFQLTYKPIGN